MHLVKKSTECKNPIILITYNKFHCIIWVTNTNVKNENHSYDSIDGEKSFNILSLSCLSSMYVHLKSNQDLFVYIQFGVLSLKKKTPLLDSSQKFTVSPLTMTNTYTVAYSVTRRVPSSSQIFNYLILNILWEIDTIIFILQLIKIKKKFTCLRSHSW